MTLEIVSSYCYSSLRKRDGADSIRLLRLLPNDDENAMIECQLFDYFLPNSDTGTHLYEALSYVWGSPHKNHSITLDNSLSRLRNRYIKRVVWIDAICINQEDLKERGYQIQCMARIFGKAESFEEIGLAADNNLATPSNTTELRNNVLRLVKRPWFRHIRPLTALIMCGAAQIDGYTFCQSFRPKSTIWWSGPTFLEINPLAKLIDMYHAQKATERHDRIFALLGMSSHNLTMVGLSPYYNVL
ncbi:hypothetical protein K469DRAFT_739522 [Zopfia rhizophila CBS 207.26]|uniref:Heterokaryon incompatibility domain-containing protein n=1 Tax=Zopfia rhizophila CBS 207.26 TaxID=1314779 RepID=A0A6A6DYC9_9PEZI|nr:hypothetical protein K469DRAFT_739522 [Zopfia rhizophila CBS 207.26]